MAVILVIYAYYKDIYIKRYLHFWYSSLNNCFSRGRSENSDKLLDVLCTDRNLVSVISSHSSEREVKKEIRTMWSPERDAQQGRSCSDSPVTHKSANVNKHTHRNTDWNVEITNSTSGSRLQVPPPLHANTIWGELLQTRYYFKDLGAAGQMRDAVVVFSTPECQHRNQHR